MCWVSEKTRMIQKYQMQTSLSSHLTISLTLLGKGLKVKQNNYFIQFDVSVYISIKSYKNGFVRMLGLLLGCSQFHIKVQRCQIFYKNCNDFAYFCFPTLHFHFQVTFWTNRQTQIGTNCSNAGALLFLVTTWKYTFQQKLRIRQGTQT